MEIKNINLDSYRSQLGRSDSTMRGREAAASAKQSSSPAPSAAQGDRVSVSRNAVLATEALQVAMSTSDIRQEKVDALKKEVASGTYRMDNTKIATKLVQSELGLFRK